MTEPASRVLPGRYVDSVLLMRLAQRLEGLDGIEQAAAMMGTNANKKVLVEGGFLTEEPAGATGNDLVVAVKAVDRAAAHAALAQVDALLIQRRGGGRKYPEARSLEEALAAYPDLNLALISAPGEYAGAEARKALDRGLHVMIFSSNVSLGEEVELKRLASRKGLLCMGPDCGTAIIRGVGLAFANAIRRGPIGVIGASGTGIQAVTSILDRLEVGVSHAIGCGSRDLSEAVGALTTLQGLDALEADRETEAILVVSKPPSPSVSARVRERATRSTKPVVCCFLGEPQGPQTLEEAALEVARAAGSPLQTVERDLSLMTSGNTDWRGGTWPEGSTAETSRGTSAPAGPQGHLRGLFAGGTLAYEAQLVLRSRGIEVFSNAPLPQGRRLEDVDRSHRHTVLDLGSEELTRGRPHPMIDSRLRRERLLQEACDPEVGIILLDFVLGYGAAADPAGDVAGPIADAIGRARSQDRTLHVIASIVGTEADPQGLSTQVKHLRDAGAVVASTSSKAAELAASLLVGTDQLSLQGARG